jgi:hypothetical protein
MKKYRVLLSFVNGFQEPVDVEADSEALALNEIAKRVRRGHVSDAPMVFNYRHVCTAKVLER